MHAAPLLHPQKTVKPHLFRMPTLPIMQAVTTHPLSSLVFWTIRLNLYICQRMSLQARRANYSLTKRTTNNIFLRVLNLLLTEITDIVSVSLIFILHNGHVAFPPPTSANPSSATTNPEAQSI